MSRNALTKREASLLSGAMPVMLGRSKRVPGRGPAVRLRATVSGGRPERHFEVQEFGARVLLEGAADGSDLTDRGLCEVFDVHGGELLVEHLLRNESCHYLRCFCAYSYPARNALRFISTICSPLRAKMLRMPASNLSASSPGKERRRPAARCWPHGARIAPWRWHRHRSGSHVCASRVQPIRPPVRGSCRCLRTA